MRARAQETVIVVKTGNLPQHLPGERARNRKNVA
jgi:hypothetical protein